MQVSAQQQELTVTVTHEDHAAGAVERAKAHTDGTVDTTRDPIARAVCRQFGIPLGSLSVGLDRIHVFDGDAAEDRLVAAYRMDLAGQQFVAKFDTFQRVSLPYTFGAVLEEIERKKAKGDYASYDVIEEPGDTEPAEEPEEPAWAQPVAIGADD